MNRSFALPFRFAPRELLLPLATLVAATTASPAAAAAEPSTRVVKCKAGSCLLVSGRRADTGSAVAINGHAVAVEGGRKWQVRVPVATVREWSAPLARSITVSVSDPRTGAEAAREAALPIGLLGQAEDLAMLVVGFR
jgi:hypothetical protein